MYDTVHLSLETSGISLQDLLNKLDWYNEPSQGFHTGNLSVKGSIQNNSAGKLQIKFSDTFPQKLTVSGSLAKFHYGNNLEELTRAETQKAIEQISERLSVDMRQAKVYRLDIGANFIMDRPCNEYQSLLNESPRMTRSTLSAKSNSLYFKNGRKTIILYDKVADCQRLKEPIPEVLQGSTFSDMSCVTCKTCLHNSNGKL